MKRSKTIKINKNYDDTATYRIPKEERDRMMKEFLDAGGIIYKSERGRRKGKLTKSETAEHNKKVLKKQRELRKANEETDRKTDEDSK